ncbi:hypothetical protein FACS189485_11310 [Spirochaetia bacterium]|nr:hypothetical protein FACS189485_11310 [Spirochaetia bacterium]
MLFSHFYDKTVAEGIELAKFKRPVLFRLFFSYLEQARIEVDGHLDILSHLLDHRI